VKAFLYGNCIPEALSDSGLVYDSAEWAGGISRPAGALASGRGRDPVEYRNKMGTDAEIAEDAAVLRKAMPKKYIKLILNDRVDLIDKIEFDGVHVDSGDAGPAEARERLGPDRIIGTFGGGDALVELVLEEPADYFSIGPAFQTTTKQTTKAPIGVDGVRRLGAQAGQKPVLVAVGGVTLETAPLVLAAGATTVAVLAAIFRAADPAGECRRRLKTLG